MILLVICRAVALSVLGMGSAWAALPYAKLAGLQATFEGIPSQQRDKIVLRQRVVHRDTANHTPIHMWVIVSGKHLAIPVGTDGTLTITPHQDWVDRNLSVESDQLHGTLAIQLHLGIVVPGATPIQVSYLRDAMRQAQQAIKLGARQQAGFFGSLVAPTVKAVSFKLARCCGESATLHGESDSVVHQVADGTIAFQRSVLDANANGSIMTSASIEEIEPSTD